MRTRREIVDKMEELYEMLKNNKLPAEYVIPITDTLDWVIGDGDYLSTDNLEYRSSIMENGEDE